MTNENYHIPVIAEKVIDLLRGKKGGIFVDATVGSGGHTSYFFEHLNPDLVIGIDRDPRAIQISSNRFKNNSRVKLFHANYAEMDQVVYKLGIQKVDVILIDAGLSSFALEDETRGFSFQKEGPLDMRMNSKDIETLDDFLEKNDVNEIARILKEYGDVRKPFRVAERIVLRKKEGNLKKVSDLVQTILEIFPAKNRIPDEVRQVFQALRIAVNNELFFLNKGLWAGMKILSKEGYFLVISFHSGEDRIVKSVFRFVSHPIKILSPEGFLRKEIPPIARVLTPKPLIPSLEEIKKNSKAKSAKLRAIEKISDEYMDYYLKGAMNP